MQTFVFNKLRSWFETYATSFQNGDPQLHDAAKLKYDHTMRVGVEMEDLCKSIQLNTETSEIARIAALFHDIARFEQFKRYRTFSDAKSVNHAEMGVALLVDHNLFIDLEPVDRDTILAAIRHHNAIEVPHSLSTQQSLVCRLLRDADKLDIYKIALEYYVNPDPMRHETIQVGIPDGRAVTQEVCEYLLMQKMVPYEKVKTFTDFKLIQLGWVYDLNFKHSLQLVKNRGYIDEIRKYLPSTHEIEKTITAVKNYLDAQL